MPNQSTQRKIKAASYRKTLMLAATVDQVRDSLLNPSAVSGAGKLIVGKQIKKAAHPMMSD